MERMPGTMCDKKPRKIIYYDNSTANYDIKYI